MSNIAASRAGLNPGPTAERVTVPLLAELLARKDDGRYRVWADLGSAQAGLVTRLTGGRNRLIVVDLPEAFEEGDTQWHHPGNLLEAAFWWQPVDCYLCWDLLNYMRPQQLGDLSRHVAERAHGEGRLHALIQYSATSMGATPGRYGMGPDALICLARPDVPLIKTPRYSPKALEKAMPELRVERTMLLNNGMQEFLFTVR